MGRKIVDFHAHAFHDKIALKAAQNLNEYYGIPLAGNGTFKVLLDDAKKHKIDTIVVHATATKPQQVPVINDYVSTLLTDGIVGFGTLHPDYMACHEELDRLISLGLKGLKFHPVFQGFAIDDEAMLPIYEMAEGRLPILMHMGDLHTDCATPARLAKVMKQFPKLTVVAAHMGGYGEQEAAKRELADFENIYVDTSSSIRFMEPEVAAGYVRAFGAERVLFGTDYPLSLYDDELRVFDAMGLSEEESEQILWKNAYKLLNLE